MNSELFEIVDSQYRPQLIQRLNSDRKSRKFTDVRLVVEDKEIFVHKVIVGVSSPWINRKLNEGAIFEMDYEFANYEAISIIVEYMYTGLVQFSMDNAVQLWQNLEILEMQSVLAILQDYLMRSVTVENCIEVLFVAKEVKYEELIEAALECIRENLEAINSSRGLQHCNADQMKAIIAASVNSNSAEVIYEVVIDWLKFSEERNDLLEEMLKFINVKDISSRFVEKQISNEHYLKKENAGRAWIIENFFTKKYLRSGKDTILNVISRYGNCVYEFHVIRRRLVKCKPKPDLCLFAMARRENTIYALGGVRYATVTDIALKYDLIKRSWTEFKCPVGRCLCGICLEDDKIFLIGGAIGTVPQKACQIFNVATESLLPMPEMIHARAIPAIAIHNSSIYAIGSFILGVEPDLLSVERYDPREGNWSKAGETSVAGHTGAELISSYIYSLGRGNKIIKYDVRVQKEALVIDSPVNGCSIASLDEELYIGHDKGITHFDLHDHSWTDVLPQSLHWPVIIS